MHRPCKNLKIPKQHCFHFYLLVTAINKFLKTPKVKITQNFDKFQVIEKGIKDFNEHYKKKFTEKEILQNLLFIVAVLKVSKKKHIRI